MILTALRWLSQLDRSYFFALSSVISALIVSVALVFTPIDTLPDGSSATLLETEGGLVLFWFFVPVLVLGTPLISLPQRPGPRERSHKINAIASTVLLMGLVLISLASFGIFYVPALIFSIASSVSLFFGKDRKAATAGASLGRRAASDDGEIRMSRSARRRLREEERLAGSVDDVAASPLESSRRRRGRNRRKR